MRGLDDIGPSSPLGPGRGETIAQDPARADGSIDSGQPPGEVPTVGSVPATPTNRIYPLPDGRILTWSHCPMRNAAGTVVVEEHAFGHLDGAPIADAELWLLLLEHGLG